MDQPANLTTAAYWEQWWQQRKQIRVLSPRNIFYGRNGTFLRTMRRHLPKLENQSIVELGGGGECYRLLALSKWLGARATAVDYSAEGIQITEQLFAANGCPVQTYVEDFFTWDPAGGRYDLVVHWGVLEHFVDPVPLLKLCARLLAPGGSMLFTMPNMQAWGAALWRRWAPQNWTKHILHTDETVARACDEAGLRLTKVFHFGPPMLPLACWETSGLLPVAVSWLNRAFYALDYVFPVYQYGWRRISNERGFLVRAANDSEDGGQRPGRLS